MLVTDQQQDRLVPSLKGDPGAFEDLIRQHQCMIDALCYRMTGSLEDAEDLAQETFVQAYQNLSAFRGEAKFSSWVYRIALNQCLNWRKRKQRHERFQQEWREQAANASDNPVPFAQQIQDALMKLDPKQRAAIVMTTYDGLTHAEAARVLGCSETTVSWRVFMARRKLKRLLKDLRHGGVR